MIPTIVKSSAVRLLGTFKDGFTPFDPSVIRFKVLRPDGTQTTYTFGTDTNVVKLSTGHYACDLEATASGVWYYRVESVTGGLTGATEGAFTVPASVFP